MIEIVKSLLIPGSHGLLVLALLGAGLLLGRPGRSRRLGWAAALAVLTGQALLGSPAVACRLAGHLARDGPLVDRRAAAGATAIVLLAGDNPEGRLRETVRLYRWLTPRWVVVSGPVALGEAVLQLGVPPGALLIESASRTTREQALDLEPVLRAHGVRRFVLVASVIHMPRALGAMRAVGLDAIPSGSPLDDGGLCADGGGRRWWPALTGLAVSRDAIYEYLARAYYSSRGWIGTRREPDPVRAGDAPAVARQPRGRRHGEESQPVKGFPRHAAGTRATDGRG